MLRFSPRGNPELPFRLVFHARSANRAPSQKAGPVADGTNPEPRRGLTCHVFPAHLLGNTLPGPEQVLQQQAVGKAQSFPIRRPTWPLPSSIGPSSFRLKDPPMPRPPPPQRSSFLETSLQSPHRYEPEQQWQTSPFCFRTGHITKSELRFLCVDWRQVTPTPPPAWTVAGAWDRAAAIRWC